MIDNMSNNQNQEEYFYSRIQLSYNLNELEPYISQEIMSNHYHGNHRKYEEGLNNILKNNDLGEKLKTQFPDLRDLLRNLSSLEIPFQLKEKIRFQAGGLINHNLFF